MRHRSTGEATAKPTTPYGRCATTRMRTNAATKAYVTRRKAEGRREPRSSAASSGISPEKSTGSSPTRTQPGTAPAYVPAA